MPNKLEKFIFLALIFSIPFQKRTFLFGPAREGENFFEWGSGFIYFTDFLIAALAIFAAIRFFRIPGQLLKPPPTTVGGGFSLILPLLFLLAFSFISLTQADLVNVGVYRFSKLAEFIFLFFYAAGRIGHIGLTTTLWTFIASGVFQSVIAILQFAKQSSLGLDIFHESTLAIHMPGVAHIAADGLFLIRAYGTFPSPNVLAGFLGLCLLFLFYLFVVGGRIGREKGNQFCSAQGGDPFNPPIIKANDSPLKSQNWFPFSRLPVYTVSIFLLTFALILTFSRGTIIFFILVSALFFAGMFLLKELRDYKETAVKLALLVIGCWLSVVVIAWPEVSSRFLGSSYDEPAIQERFFFNKVGIESVREDPMRALFGVGIGNFVHNFRQIEPGLPEYLYQPAHNIFILIASETGTLGFFAFVFFVALLLERLIRVFWTYFSFHVYIQNLDDRPSFVYGYVLLCSLFFILLIAMYDHYFWTLQQGALMFWIVLGIAAKNSRFSAQEHSKK